MKGLFQNVKISMKITPVSATNNLYPYKDLVDAELSLNASCKEGRLRCQGYDFEEDRSDLSDGKTFSNRKKHGDTFTSKWSQFGRLSDNFLSDNNKILLARVEVHVRLDRVPNHIVMIHGEASKDSQADCSIQIVRAFLLVQNLEFKNETYPTIERLLSKRQLIMVFETRYRSLPHFQRSHHVQPTPALLCSWSLREVSVVIVTS